MRALGLLDTLPYGHFAIAMFRARHRIRPIGAACATVLVTQVLVLSIFKLFSLLIVLSQWRWHCLLDSTKFSTKDLFQGRSRNQTHTN